MGTSCNDTSWQKLYSKDSEQEGWLAAPVQHLALYHHLEHLENPNGLFCNTDFADFY